MQLIVLKAPQGNTSWLAAFLEAMGWQTERSPVGRERRAAAAGDASATRRLSVLNTDALSVLQSTWYHVDNLPLGGEPPGLPYPLKKEMEACAEDLNRLGPWVCDDPAMCILSPYWRPLLPEPLYLLYAEHPFDVALRLRDAWRFPLAFGLSLWEYYMRAALLSTQGQDRLIVTQERLANRPDEVLRKVAQRLGSASDHGFPGGASMKRITALVSAVLPDRDPECLAFMNESQLAFHRALCAGEVDEADVGLMSAASRDILQMYGRLRAGFDSVRQERDALRRRALSVPPPASPDADTLAPTEPLSTRPPHMDDADIIDVTIHLRDMQPLWFSCTQNNPILDQLIQALTRSGATGAADDIFYLELGSTTVYFPVSQLLAVYTDGDSMDARSHLWSTGTNVETAPQATPRSGEARRRRSVAILVLGCLLPQYERSLGVIEGTWASKQCADIDVYYALGAHFDRTAASARSVEKYYGKGVPMLRAFQAQQVGNVIACGCADTIHLQSDSLLRKRLIAFSYLAGTARYDFVYTVCASSYVDQARLREYVESVDEKMLFHGPVGVCRFTGRPYVSGASMLFSIDLIERLVQNTYRILEDNKGRYADDVAFGAWIAKNVSGTAEDRIVENIRAGRRATQDNTFVMPRSAATVDYVGVNSAQQVLVKGAYHYHFQTDTIEQMADFHRRFFE